MREEDVMCKKIVLKGFKKHRASCNICPQCGYTNPRKQRLMMHIKTFHNRPDGLKEYFEFPSFETFLTVLKRRALMTLEMTSWLHATFVTKSLVGRKSDEPYSHFS